MNTYLQSHIEKSIQRLNSPEYAIAKVLQDSEYSWQGDYEGRALLAFCQAERFAGKDFTRATELFNAIKPRLNEQGFLGETFNQSKISEQQLSGHSWLLCGLTEYYQLHGDKSALAIADNVVNNLFLPSLFAYDVYPCKRKKKDEGAVSGTISETFGGWELSTDIGCAFICIDGLTRYYQTTGNVRVVPMIDKLVRIFLSIDHVGLKMQTHATLSASRGILRYYEITGKKEYVDGVKNIYKLYLEKGMTDTFENFNWFGREDTWTEPCAVVDSLMLSCQLFAFTGEENYKKIGRRIWFNGLSFCHRDNGGAGPNSCVTKANPVLKISMYEAPFCCTMRYMEGLTCVNENASLFDDGDLTRWVDEKGRTFIGDVLLVKDCNGIERKLTDLSFAGNNGDEYTLY